MKTMFLFAALAISALLLFGCAGNPGENQDTISSSSQGANDIGAQADSGSAGSSNAGDAGAQAGADNIASGSVKEFTVEATSWDFSPSTITVNEGDTVKITLISKDAAHGIGINDFGFDLKVGAGEAKTGQFVASKKGAYTFRCNVFCGDGHTEMTGTLVVD